MTKLTLSIDEKVIIAAKRISKKKGTSISKMVEDYLKRVTKPVGHPERKHTILSLRGIGGKVSGSFDYKRELKKYFDQKYQ